MRSLSRAFTITWFVSPSAAMSIKTSGQRRCTECRVSTLSRPFTMTEGTAMP